MKTADKIKNIFQTTGDSLASILKVALMSRRLSPPASRKDSTLIIMGNGPSLREAIDSHGDVLEKYDLLSVNFAPLSADFFSLRPEMHLLADGVFFQSDAPGNVAEMWSTLSKADWRMSLYVPVKYRSCLALKTLPSNIKVRYFNLTPASGWGWLVRRLFRSGLAMPRPRNVLVPSLMTAIREGYSRIVLTGADHSWSKSLWVTDNNRVVTVQPHFYEDNEKERERVESLYKGIRIHQIYESFSIAFRSYFAVKDFADSEGVEILNATPGSFIDAFPRTRLELLG